MKHEDLDCKNKIKITDHKQETIGLEKNLQNFRKK